MYGAFVMCPATGGMLRPKLFVGMARSPSGVFRVFFFKTPTTNTV
jgi:hypothetical protein